MKPARTKLDPYQGVDIYIDTQGTFWAKVGNREYSAKSVDTLQRKIASQTKAFDAIVINSYNALDRPQRIRVIRELNGRFRNADNGELFSSLYTVYRFDETVFNTLETIWNRYWALYREYQGTLENLKRL